MDFEYYYLFGVDIPLGDYKLGTRRQPKLKDYIINNINLEMFYVPFLYVDMIIGKSEDSDEIKNIVKELGTFNFLLKTCLESKNINVLIAIQES